MITIEIAIQEIDKALGETTWMTLPFHNEETNRQMVYERCRGYDKIRLIGYKEGIIVESLKRRAEFNYVINTEELDSWIDTYLSQDPVEIEKENV